MCGSGCRGAVSRVLHAGEVRVSVGGFSQVIRAEWGAGEGGGVRVAVKMVAGAVAAAVVSGSIPARAAAPEPANLSVRVSASPSTAQPGRPITYRVDVRNAGPGEAVRPVLTVVVPDAVDISSVDVVSCRPGRTLGEVVCPSPENVAAGGTGGVTITGTVRRDAVGPLRLVARMAAQGTDADAGNGATLVTGVDQGADLGVRLKARQERDGAFTVVATVHNRGPRAVLDARVAVRAEGARPAGPAAGQSCRRRAGETVCEPVTVPSGGTVRFELPYLASRGPVRVRGEVRSSRLGDRRPDDNEAALRVASR